MLQKAKLVKKQTLEKTLKPIVSEKRELAQLTQHIAQSTKDWLVNHRQQKHLAKQTFAALFMNSDTQSNAI